MHSDNESSVVEPEQGQEVTPPKTETDLMFSAFRSASIDLMEISDASDSGSQDDESLKESKNQNLIG